MHWCNFFLQVSHPLISCSLEKPQNGALIGTTVLSCKSIWSFVVEKWGLEYWLCNVNLNIVDDSTERGSLKWQAKGKRSSRHCLFRLYVKWGVLVTFFFSGFFNWVLCVSLSFGLTWQKHKIRNQKPQVLPTFPIYRWRQTMRVE